jgi:hypothetical protein
MTILVIVSAAARAQVVPAATRPPGLPLSGTLHYDVHYTQTAQFYGGTRGNTQMSIVSGEVAYSNAGTVYPFTLSYSGGDMWTISGPREGAGIFQHLLVSQGFLGRSWTFNLSDDVSYLPQAPTVGFSGIPGVGSLPGVPSEPSQPILTQNTRSINNTASPSFTHRLNHATDLSISGGYLILRFPDGNGLETNSLQVGPRITRRLNALNSISGQYSFTHISYPGYTSFTMGTQSAMFIYERTWSRRFKTSAGAGPQWIQSSDSKLIPSSTDVTVNANATYDAGRTTATLNYNQGASGGAGVTTQIGVHNYDAMAGLSRKIGRNLNINFTGTYMRTKGLTQSGVTYAEDGGAAVTRQWGRYIVVNANYAAIHQSTSAALPANAISGLYNVIGFGIGYSPRETHLRK